MKIIVDNKIPFIRGEVERLADEVIYLPGAAISASDVADADILIVRTRTKCNRQLLEGSTVRFIVTATIGYDHIDTEYCAATGIQWTNCPGCNARSVNQYVTNAISALGITPAGKVMAVVGVGHVGSLVVKTAADAGFTVLMSDPPLQEAGTTAEKLLSSTSNDFIRQSAHHADHTRPRFASIQTICQQADIITFHTPLTRTGSHPTHHLADARFFHDLLRRPVIINASRGGVVDETALKAALTDGTVSHAVIDTWEGEPHIDADLLARADITTPHIAGYSANGKRNATLMSLHAVREFILKTTNPSDVLHARCTAATFDIPLPQAPRLTPGTLMDDSRRLKENADCFEDFRGNYPVRIEQ
ncbi:MAG: 4-phosphoerythronate dehydrogenase [Prevotellaceae bacterium]|nr:4-phosphoerythronate dehydrogenase [Candidatus Colivivens caballi]